MLFPVILIDRFMSVIGFNVPASVGVVYHVIDDGVVKECLVLGGFSIGCPMSLAPTLVILWGSTF